MHFAKLLPLLSCLLISFTVAAQQDTVHQRHSFKLPMAVDQKGYENDITQQPFEVHSFEFVVPGSCTVFFVVRSENDSLDIRLGNRAIKLKSKQDGKYVYSFAGVLPAGENKCYIRTRKYCGYSVYIKGQL